MQLLKSLGPALSGMQQQARLRLLPLYVHALTLDLFDDEQSMVVETLVASWLDLSAAQREQLLSYMQQHTAVLSKAQYQARPSLALPENGASEAQCAIIETLNAERATHDEELRQAQQHAARQELEKFVANKVPMPRVDANALSDLPHELVQNAFFKYIRISCADDDDSRDDDLFHAFLDSVRPFQVDDGLAVVLEQPPSEMRDVWLSFFCRFAPVMSDDALGRLVRLVARMDFVQDGRLDATISLLAAQRRLSTADRYALIWRAMQEQAATDLHTYNDSVGDLAEAIAQENSA